MNTKIFSEIIPGDFIQSVIRLCGRFPFKKLSSSRSYQFAYATAIARRHETSRVALTARLVFHLIFTHLLPLSEDRRDSCEVKILFKYAIFFATRQQMVEPSALIMSTRGLP